MSQQTKINNEEEYNIIVEYLQRQAYLSAFNKEQKRTVQRKAENFCLIDKIFFLKITMGF